MFVRTEWLPGVSLILGLALTCAATAQVYRAETREIRAFFKSDATELLNIFWGQLEDGLQAVEYLRRFFESSTFVEWEEFRSFVQPAFGKNRSIRALEWAPRVRGEDRVQFEDVAQQEGLRRFQITEWNAQGHMVRAKGRKAYFPVRYMEPYEGNESALGFDLASESVRRDTLERARDTGELSLSGLLDLVQARTPGYGFLAVRPIYTPGLALTTVEQRREALGGFVLGVFRFSDLLHNTTLSMISSEAAKCQMKIFDETTQPGGLLLYDSSQRSPGIRAMTKRSPAWAKGLSVDKTFELGERVWRISIFPSDAWASAIRFVMPGVVFLMGLLATILISTYLLGLSLHKRRLSVLNANLVQEVASHKQTNIKMMEVERQLRIRTSITEVFLAVSDDQVYGQVLEILLASFMSRFGIMGYISDNGDLIVPSMTQDIWDKCRMTEKSMVFPKETWGDSSWSRAIREKRGQYSNEPSKLTPEGHIEITRHVSWPIVFQGEVLSIIILANRDTDYSEQDVEMLNGIAAYIAPILRERQESVRSLVRLEQLCEDLKQSHEQLKNSQMSLIQAEKLNSVGRLAAGVAHEVKNPLGILLQGIDYLLSKKLDAADPIVADVLQEMQSATRRADLIVKGLLDYSSPTKIVFSSADLNSVVRYSLLFVRYDLDKNQICVVEDLEEGLPPIVLDVQKIQQVFVNLLLNAIHAMGKGGTLTIRTCARQIADAGGLVGYRNDDRFLPGEKVVAVEIEDTGSGIAENRLSKVFDPFFTTKPPGEGTGLGLSVSQKIVELHGGMIQIGNRKEGGVRATMILKMGGGDSSE
ncbi:MAG: CHASE domain-containing protein [Candidatus Omnitrophica bacterium]|nr:CHASE domain-containing protein [Candidatus Omnitrophota bacterium]